MMQPQYKTKPHFFFLFDICVFKERVNVWAFRWLKDGRELTDQHKFSIVNDPRSGILSLTVIGATEADIGQYECEV